MSPSITGGSPHTRAASVNGGGPTTTVNGAKGNGVDWGLNMKKIWPHHDDLVAAMPSVDRNSSIEKILREGDQHAKAADTSLDFQRPDIALQEYVRASIIAAEIIPHHKDFPALQSDRKDLQRLYMGLVKRIKTQDEKFTHVKMMIKENNTIHGTTSNISSAAIRGAQTKSVGNLQNGTENHLVGAIVDRAPRKKPPQVQPKPESLHGKALQSSETHTRSASQPDLLTRFARLRSPEPSPSIQDPRVRTQPILIPKGAEASAISPQDSSATNKSSKTRTMPSVPTTVLRPAKISLDIDLPGLPRAPDAIYSPARGTETAATANLPSSIARNGSYIGTGRKTAAPPISTVGPTPGSVENKMDYFTQVQRVDPSTQLQKSSSRQRIVSPETTMLTAEELVALLQRGSHATKILLVDLRSREDFDNGHILSQFVICVEPITLRQGISGDELTDSMVIAPDVEQKIFELRHTFDLLVFYDQGSLSIDPPKPTEASTILRDFARAVYDYGYERQLKQPPVLLVGGLNAWIDLLGPSSLETSSTGKSLKPTAQNGAKKARPLGASSLSRRNEHAVVTARRRTYQSRPLSKEEETKWESAMREDMENATAVGVGGSASNEILYARTTEDFIRRYPELPAIQESMVSSVPKPSLHTLEAELASTMPRPPARPPPALPRQRSSGISEAGTTVSYAPQPSATTSISTLRQPRGLTGISNSGNTCYLNSSIQGLSATPFLRRLLLSSTGIQPVPRKDGEVTNPPQLLAKCLQNLVGHLWCGQYDFINPKTFRQYVNAIHTKSSMLQNAITNSSAAFGGACQHDAYEFLAYILDILDDEMNPERNRPGGKKMWSREDWQDLTNNYPTLADGAARYLELQHPNQQSLFSKKLKVVTCQVVTCDDCHKETRNYEPHTMLNLHFPQNERGEYAKDKFTLNEVIEWNFGDKAPPQTFSARDCNFCSPPGDNKDHPERRHPATAYTYIVYWPETLIINLHRYRGEEKKVPNQVMFPEQVNLNMCKRLREQKATADRYSMNDAKYDIYGCIMHIGETMKSGHYIAYARSPDLPKNGGAGDWHLFNDTEVKAASFKDTQNKERGTTAVVLFLQKTTL